MKIKLMLILILFYIAVPSVARSDVLGEKKESAKSGEGEGFIELNLVLGLLKTKENIVNDLLPDPRIFFTKNNTFVKIGKRWKK